MRTKQSNRRTQSMTKEKNQDYRDIIHLPPHKSKKHPSMPLYNRAAQFSPFAALTGHSDIIKETERKVLREMEE